MFSSTPSKAATRSVLSLIQRVPERSVGGLVCSTKRGCGAKCVMYGHVHLWIIKACEQRALLGSSRLYVTCMRMPTGNLGAHAQQRLQAVNRFFRKDPSLKFYCHDYHLLSCDHHLLSCDHGHLNPLYERYGLKSEVVNLLSSRSAPYICQHNLIISHLKQKLNAIDF